MIAQHAEVFNNVDKFEKDLGQLVSIFEKKASLTAQQETHIQLKADLSGLKTHMLADIDSAPGQLRELQER